MLASDEDKANNAESADEPVAYVCHGPNCSKKPNERLEGINALDGVAKMKAVRCQGICIGPVFGLTLDGKHEWFARVDDASARRAFCGMFANPTVPRELRTRWVRRKSGQKE